ncbi:MAG TPA: hypothetical protein VGR10_06465, partial [Thermoleophilaceae bacterium]|nr:hypothetical protein [Thermoleophilaceae bacterium]
GLTGQQVRLECRLSGEAQAPEPARLSPDELVSRVMDECDARELVDDPPPTADLTPTDQD